MVVAEAGGLAHNGYAWGHGRPAQVEAVGGVVLGSKGSDEVARRQEAGNERGVVVTGIVVAGRKLRE